MPRRATRAQLLTPLGECSFGCGKCVFADEREAARRCPKAKTADKLAGISSGHHEHIEPVGAVPSAGGWTDGWYY